MEKRVVFIDRDGTMGGDKTPEHPWDYTPFSRTAEAFALLNRHGFFPVVVTNQSCIARGKAGDYDFGAEFRAIGAADWFLCPHDTADGCDCRKPAPGLLYRARDKYGLDLSEAYMIGDRWSDMAAGGRAGCRLILVRTGRGGEALGRDREKWREYEPAYVAEDLYDAACWLCERGANAGTA